MFKLLTKDMFELIAKQSFIYAQQHTCIHFDFNYDAEDFMAFVGVFLICDAANTSVNDCTGSRSLF